MFWLFQTKFYLLKEKVIFLLKFRSCLFPNLDLDLGLFFWMVGSGTQTGTNTIIFSLKVGISTPNGTNFILIEDSGSCGRDRNLRFKRGFYLGIILFRCTDRKSVSNPPSCIFQVEVYNSWKNIKFHDSCKL